MKDTLGDSGLLLESDATVVNTPKKKVQVDANTFNHYLTDKIANFEYSCIINDNTSTAKKPQRFRDIYVNSSDSRKPLVDSTRWTPTGYNAPEIHGISRLPFNTYDENTQNSEDVTTTTTRFRRNYSASSVSSTLSDNKENCFENIENKINIRAYPIQSMFGFDRTNLADSRHNILQESNQIPKMENFANQSVKYFNTESSQTSAEPCTLFSNADVNSPSRVSQKGSRRVIEEGTFKNYDLNDEFWFQFDS